MRSVIAIVVTVGVSSPVLALTQGEIEAKLVPRAIRKFRRSRAERSRRTEQSRRVRSGRLSSTSRSFGSALAGWPVLGQRRCQILALGGPPSVCIGSPAARSSGWCGLARPTVPGGASLLAVRVSRRSDVIADPMAMARAIADRTKAARFGSIIGPPRNGSIVPGDLVLRFSHKGYPNNTRAITCWSDSEAQR